MKVLSGNYICEQSFSPCQYDEAYRDTAHNICLDPQSLLVEDLEPVLTRTSNYSSDHPDVDENAEITGTTIAVSNAFYPGANIDSHPCDLILGSSDLVFFYVHSSRLWTASNNGFNHILSVKWTSDQHPVIYVSQQSPTLDVLLRVIYRLSIPHNCLSTDGIVEVVDALKIYGVPLKEHVSPSTSLFQLLALHAASHPMELYTLAAAHGLEDLAVTASTHLLSYSLSTLSDEMAKRMGPIYLKRLFFLHMDRVDALKRLLISPPTPHTPTTECGPAEQQKISRVWALASAYFAWDAQPDLPPSMLKVTFSPLLDQLDCDICKQALQERVTEVMGKWAAVKRTI